MTLKTGCRIGCNLHHASDAVRVDVGKLENTECGEVEIR